MRRTIPSLLLILLLVTLSTQSVVAAEQPSKSLAKTSFLVVYRPGPGWLEGKPITEQPLKEHFTYMLDLYSRGTMKFAGPFTDNEGGAVVLAVADKVEALAIVAQDPAIKTKVFVAEIHPWEMKDWEGYLQKSRARPNPKSTSVDRPEH